MQETARKLIKRALQVAGILTKNEQPSADEVNDALSVLNGMISSWSNDSLLVFYRESEQFQLVTGKVSYTIGSGGDFNTARPNQIVSCYIRSQDATDYPLKPMSDRVYDGSVMRKSVQSIPEFFQYDAANPVGMLTIWPSPVEAYPIFIRSEKVLESFVLDDVVDLPPGWVQAIVYNLAFMLAPEYGQQADQTVFKIAGDSLGSIKDATAKNRTMDTPPLTRMGGFDIYSGRNWR